jgi:hypothetical protein
MHQIEYYIIEKKSVVGEWMHYGIYWNLSSAEKTYNYLTANNLGYYRLLEISVPAFVIKCNEVNSGTARQLPLPEATEL